MRKRIVFILAIVILTISITALSSAEDSKTISVEKTEFYEGEKIRVNYTGAEDKDWIGIYPRGGIPGAKDESGNVIGSLQWGYLYDIDGEFVFMDDLDPTSKTEPLTPGEYDLYYLKNDAYEVADKVEFTIVAGANPDKPLAPSELTYERTATKKGFAEGIVKIKKPNEGPDIDEYVLYWANASGKLDSYSSIATIKVTGEVTEYTISDSLLIPVYVTNIIAYSKSGTNISEEYAKASVDANAILPRKTMIYSFNVLSDIHIGATYDANLERALKTIIKRSPDTIGIFTVGDNTESGKAEQYEKLMGIIESNLSDKRIPMYFSLGNHDMAGSFDSQVSLFKEHTKMTGVYHYTVIKNTYFIHLGNEDPNAGSNPVLITETQLKWLEDLLEEASKRKGPIFIFLHQPLYDTVAGSLPNQGWDGVKNPEVLRNVLDKYPSVMLFTGHTHWKFDSAKTMLDGKGSKANYFNSSSVAYLWTDNDTHYDGSQGYFVEVYKDYILVKGYDFELNEWSSCAQFILMIDSEFPTGATPITTSSTGHVGDSKNSPMTPIIIAAIVIVAIVIVIMIARSVKKKK